MQPLYADFIANAGKVFIGILAVAGGFLIGNWLTLLICRVLAKFAFKQKINNTLERALRVIGGIIVAILVALIVFRGGSGWGFGGSGDGEGAGPGGEGKADPTDKNQRDTRADPKANPKSLEITKERITVLTPADFPNTFRFDGQRDGLDLEAAKKHLRSMKEANEKLGQVELYFYRDSTADSHPDVVKFEAFAHSLALGTLRVKPDRKLE